MSTSETRAPRWSTRRAVRGAGRSSRDRAEIERRQCAVGWRSPRGPSTTSTSHSSTTRPRHVRNTSATRPQHVRDTSATRPRHVHDTSATRPRHVTVLPQAALRGPQAQPARREGEGRGSGGARHLCRVLASAGCARRLASSLPPLPLRRQPLPVRKRGAEKTVRRSAEREAAARGCGRVRRLHPPPLSGDLAVSRAFGDCHLKRCGAMAEPERSRPRLRSRLISADLG